MFLRDLLRDETDDCGIDIEEFEINRRNAVLPGQHGGDHIVRNEPKLHEIEAESTTVFTLVVECLSQVLRANKIFANEYFA
jgi:hypothetical protein